MDQLTDIKRVHSLFLDTNYKFNQGLSLLSTDPVFSWHVSSFENPSALERTSYFRFLQKNDNDYRLDDVNLKYTDTQIAMEHRIFRIYPSSSYSLFLRKCHHRLTTDVRLIALSYPSPGLGVIRISADQLHNEHSQNTP